MDSLATRFKKAIDGQTCIFGIVALYSFFSVVAPMLDLGSDAPEWEKTPDQKADEALAAHVQEIAKEQSVYMIDAQEIVSDIVKEAQNDRFDAEAATFDLGSDRSLSMSAKQIGNARIEHALAAAGHFHEVVGAQKRAARTAHFFAGAAMLLSLYGAGLRVNNNMAEQKKQSAPSIR